MNLRGKHDPSPGPRKWEGDGLVPPSWRGGEWRRLILKLQGPNGGTDSIGAYPNRCLVRPDLDAGRAAVHLRRPLHACQPAHTHIFSPTNTGERVSLVCPRHSVLPTLQGCLPSPWQQRVLCAPDFSSRNHWTNALRGWFLGVGVCDTLSGQTHSHNLTFEIES